MGWTTGQHLQEATNLSDQDSEQILLCEQYRVAPVVFWQLLHIPGDDGYDYMRIMQPLRWCVVSSWGLEGWNLGDWPLVVILHRRTTCGFELAYKVEGDITVYRYPTRDLRDAATDCLALWHWIHDGKDWVDGVESIDAAPDRLRGPFSWERLTTSTLRWNGV
jgi:hypothetical protein